jgi:DNA primase
LNDPAALAWFANLGCIEIHTWHSRVDDAERPDYLLIDLDPSAAGQWKAVREISLATKQVMDELGLPSYVKTSGSTGMHIMAPILRELEFPEVRRFAKAMAKEIERRVPRVATTTWAVKDRTGVFVDYGQNARDRTIASAYSVRPVPDARVSAPLRWDEVATVEPEAFTIETMRDRVKAVGDLTAGMWERGVNIAPLFERVGEKPPGQGPRPRRRTADGGPWRDWRADHRSTYEARKKAARGS